MTRKPTTPAARRRQRLRAMWQRAINAKERGSGCGLCQASRAITEDDENELHRMLDLFDDRGNGAHGYVAHGYIWAWPWRDYIPIVQHDPDETARIIAATIMRETVT